MTPTRKTVIEIDPRSTHNGFERSQFFIPGQMPGLNELINTARGTKGMASIAAAAGQKRKWTERAALYIRDAMIRLDIKTYTNPVFVDLVWLEQNRRRDPDNIVSAKKFVFDGMVLAGMLPNDGWKNIKGFSDTWRVDKGCQGVWVTVWGC